jgi:hypothetical protein
MKLTTGALKGPTVWLDGARLNKSNNEFDKLSSCAQIMFKLIDVLT